MSKSRLEWKVGLFVLIGLALLGVLVLEFSKGMTLFRSTYVIYLHSKDVGGLKTRAGVLMSGVQVGAVSDIKLASDGKSVTIVLQIYKPYVIYKDAKFNIETSGFLGDQYVAITPMANSLPPFNQNNGETAEAEEPFNIQAFLGSSGKLIERLEGTASRLNDVIADAQRLVLNPQTLTNLTVTVANARTLSAHALTTVDNINDLVVTNRDAIALSISNLQVFSERLNQDAAALADLVAANRPGIDRSVGNIEASTEALKSALENVKAGKGLAGNLLNNEQLSEKITEIVNNLSITTSNLNRAGLWGILWRHKLATTNAPAVQALAAPKNPYE
jgi:phospholipid/cholesterol/gamma-HCH transport system substrate-binding protein